jgi:AcrR family transcriptional regulator
VLFVRLPKRFNEWVTEATDSTDLRRDALRSRQALVHAATAAFHREGLRVPMGTIAADAGVGIGTLYRHFPTRDDLVSYLTHRSFEQVLANARAAESEGATPTDCLRLFVHSAISQRDELVLPLHGGPPIASAATAAVRDEIHRIVQRIVERGVADHTLRPDLTPREIVAFGALLAQPRPIDTDWDDTCRGVLETYLRGLHPH